MRVEDADQRNVHEEALGSRLRLSQAFVLQVAGHDARVVSPVPTRRCRGGDEFQPQLHGLRRRLSVRAPRQRDRLASVSQQSLVHRPPPDTPRRRRLKRIEKTALSLPAHERERRPPERQMPRRTARRSVEQPRQQSNPRRWIVSRGLDLRLSPGARVSAFAQHRLEYGRSAITSSSAHRAARASRSGVLRRPTSRYRERRLGIQVVARRGPRHHQRHAW